MSTNQFWIEEARERMAQDAECIRVQKVLIAEMHAAIQKMADALHQGQLAINAYIEVKNDHLAPRKRARK